MPPNFSFSYEKYNKKNHKIKLVDHILDNLDKLYELFKDYKPQGYAEEQVYNWLCLDAMKNLISKFRQKKGGIPRALATHSSKEFIDNQKYGLESIHLKCLFERVQRCNMSAEELCKLKNKLNNKEDEKTKKEFIGQQNSFFDTQQGKKVIHSFSDGDLDFMLFQNIEAVASISKKYVQFFQSNNVRMLEDDIQLAIKNAQNSKLYKFKQKFSNKSKNPGFSYEELDSIEISDPE